MRSTALLYMKRTRLRVLATWWFLVDHLFRTLVSSVTGARARQAVFTRTSSNTVARGALLFGPCSTVCCRADLLWDGFRTSLL